MKYICSICLEWFLSKRREWLTIRLFFLYLQGLPTTTISPRYDLPCPLRTTTNPYPTNLPTVWTETPWEGDVTPFTPPHQAPEMVQPPQSLFSCKTAGYSTATYRWRQGQNICLLYYCPLFLTLNSSHKITVVKCTMSNQWKGMEGRSPADSTSLLWATDCCCHRKIRAEAD